MSQRGKARSFIKAEGHGDQLQHVTTRVTPKSAMPPGGPNVAIDPAAMGGNGLQAPPSAPLPPSPGGGTFRRGGRV